MIRHGLVVLALAGAAHAQPAPKAPPKPVNAPTAAQQLLAEVEGNYKKPQHLMATFDQTVFNPTMGTTQPSGGTFQVEKPNKLRFDYLQPKRKDPKVNTTYLFDGKSMWMIDRKGTQYGQQAVAGSSLPSLLSFFLGAGSLARDFNVASATDPAMVPASMTGLELTSKKPSATYAKIVLVVDAKRMVTQVSIVNTSGIVQTMKFTSVTLDKPAPAGTFVFDPKSVAGYNLVKP